MHIYIIYVCIFTCVCIHVWGWRGDPGGNVAKFVAERLPQLRGVVQHLSKRYFFIDNLLVPSHCIINVKDFPMVRATWQSVCWQSLASRRRPAPVRERDFCIVDLLVRDHFIIHLKGYPMVRATWQSFAPSSCTYHLTERESSLLTTYWSETT